MATTRSELREKVLDELVTLSESASDEGLPEWLSKVYESLDRRIAALEPRAFHMLSLEERVDRLERIASTGAR